MDSHYLNHFFNPRSIAVVGASNRDNSVGMKVFSNLLQGGFSGQLYAVNPNHTSILDEPCFPSVTAIKKPVELAVIVTPAQAVPDVISECGEQNIHAAIILSAGFSETGKEGKSLEEKIIEAGARHHVRMIGPNCLGMMLPHLGLNATFNNINALAGNLALVSQSGAICAAILDWAKERHVGFSAVISLGNAADIDFSDALDYLALDPKTESILLYVEGIRHARHFLSSLRVAARMKPVVVIKGGRFQQGSRAALSHTGAIVGRDDVFDAAIKRAGAVRVMSIEQLFSAAQTLASKYRAKGDRLAIVTNGGGAGVMAADRAAELNIPLPEPDKATFDYLNQILPGHWSHHNPIDILGDATPERYRKAVAACLSDPHIDGVVTILVPVVMSQPDKVAEEVITASSKNDKPIIACWMGEHQVKSARKLFAKHQLPCFSTPESAIEAFSYLANYYINQQLLLQVPEPLAYQSKPDITGARLIIDSALAEKRKILTLTESKAILNAFGIPVTQTIEAHTANEALVVAESLGFPLAMKIYSPDITHKQDVGGVRLNVPNAEAVRETFSDMIAQAKQKCPDADIVGVTLERMYKNPNDRELMIGVLRDPVFGPVISFGAGGSFVEVIQDAAITLPPLNQFLAKKLIAQTRMAKLLGKFRNMPAVNLTAIENILLRVSEMVCELPQIQEMDINPIIINENEAIAIDARILVDIHVPMLVPYSHMAIHPYPHHLISRWQLADGTNITIRPIRPEDAEIEQAFVRSLSPQSKYFRFMEHLQELTQTMLVRFTQIDYDREMALIAAIHQDNKEKNIGVARYIINPDQESCEFALVVADAWQGKGIGSHLMTNLIEEAKMKGLKTMKGEILANNHNMLQLAESLGFTIQTRRDDTSIKIAIKTLD
ncbi:bifunctional acetate--CoA ligase family protein/GNAT family N-acetyltransferase [Aquicella lusitana]|uniref:Acetyltransferase n=1 Tax=Aquicella lusitana TaxID=254246 RepID=A0A370G3P3_9COXI|nr:bifunctional acetate--CoA ligase family protein/GNAT family N-acetyltransferase [Aquicella lusitana]RDI36673.1 acetyltransferase [Aquicella lusitana]VVC74053.1 Acetyltransferase Pat [Aquicella lusitana]